MVGRLQKKLHTSGTGPMFITSCAGWVNGEEMNYRTQLAAPKRVDWGMLVMVIERFKGGDPRPIGE